MFNNVGLDIFIGLVFIYLLYSLLATIIAEIIATLIGLRARNLKEAVDRMLNDESDKKIIRRVWDSINILKDPNNEVINKFYNNPEIKYLGSTGIFKNPSSFNAESFSRTLLYGLNGSGILDRKNIEMELRNLSAIPVQQNPNPPNPGVSNNRSRTLGLHSAQFVLSLFNDSQGDLFKFRLLLETWFDRTMEQALEWYKRKIQVVLLILGFLMAWCFNANTFVIIDKLSTDKDAREKLVNMASAYLQSQEAINNGKSENFQSNNITDLIFEVEKNLQTDIKAANSILGRGSWLPDKVLIVDEVNGRVTFDPEVDSDLIQGDYHTGTNGERYYTFSFTQKLSAFLWLFVVNFWGFLITALAISLGAPFWFDLLNKLMKLRTSVKHSTNTVEISSKDNVSPLNRIG